MAGWFEQNTYIAICEEDNSGGTELFAVQLISKSCRQNYLSLHDNYDSRRNCTATTPLLAYKMHARKGVIDS